MRLFIAVELDEDMKRTLRGILRELRRRGVRGNFTPEDNLHLTLAFIGEYPDPERALEAMGTVDFAPLTLRLTGLGSFGSLWWAGLEDSPALGRLAAGMRRALADAGIPFDKKRFSPHITLVRKPEYKTDPRLDTLIVPPAETTVREAVLMCSTRGKSGMIYTPVGSVSAG